MLVMSFFILSNSSLSNSIKIEKTNLKPLIDAIYEEEGFKKEKNYGEIVFKYDKLLLDKEIEKILAFIT